MAQIIVIDGADFTGKTATVKALSEALLKLGKKVLIVREPGGNPHCEKIRDLILEIGVLSKASRYQALLFTASREILLAETVIPALDTHDYIIYDRWVPSTLVYQGALKNDMAYAQALTSLTLDDLVEDMKIHFETIVLTIQPEVYQKRLAERGAENSYDPTDLDALLDLDAHYRNLVGYGSPWHLVDNSDGQAVTAILGKLNLN